MAKAPPPPELPATLPPPKHSMVVLRKGFSGPGLDFCTLEELAYRDLPLWRRIWMRLRRR